MKQPKANDSFNEIGFMPLGFRDLFVKTIPVNNYEYYLSGYIGEVEEYLHVVNVIRNMEEHDTMTIYINSLGGNLFTGIQLSNAIQSTNGTVTAHLDGQVASAATLVALSCHRFIVAPDTYWMSHTASYGTVGKASEIFSQADFDQPYFRKLLERHYNGFFTKKEINDMIRGVDFYADAEQVVERLTKKSKLRLREAKRQMKTIQQGEQQ